MLYPQIVNVNKSRTATKILLVISISISVALFIINYFVNKKLNWSIVAVVSIVYIWYSVIYILSKSANLASYILFQMVADSILVFIIDYVFDFRGWSLSIGIPIIIIACNITMVIITMIKSKKYMKYAFYEILILLFSIAYDIAISIASDHSPLLNIITLWVCITNLSLVLILNHEVLKIELEKKFHI